MKKQPTLLRPAEPLGHFEQVLLIAIMSLRDGAYGVPILGKACELTGKNVNQGALYLTLNRMEDKGLVEAWDGDRSENRRGKPRRYYRVLPVGAQALQEAMNKADRLSEAFTEAWRLGKWKTRPW